MRTGYKNAALAIITTVLPFAATAEDSVTNRWGGDVAPKNFSEFCAGGLPADRRAEFNSAFAATQDALNKGNTAAANDAFLTATRAVYRGGPENDLSVKCQGKEIAGQWFSMRLELYRQLSAAGGKQTDLPAIYSTAATRTATDLIASFSTAKPAQFISGLNTLDNIVTNLANERDYGAFMLPEEARLESTGNTALVALKHQAEENHEQTLADEAEMFNGPPTQLELDAEQTVKSAQGIMTMVSGIDTAADDQSQALVLSGRANRSRTMLRDAEIWDLRTYVDPQSSPVAQRARQRGDFMLGKATDKSFGPNARDDFYNDAIAYYALGGWDQQRRQADAGKDALQPELEIAKQQQKAAVKKAADEAMVVAEDAREAALKMQKTDAEKQSFNDEADALEAELGF